MSHPDLAAGGQQRACQSCPILPRAAGRGWNHNGESDGGRIYPEVVARVVLARDRLKIKAFHALTEGRSLAPPGGKSSCTSQPCVELPPELDGLIERMFSAEDV